MSSPTKSQNCAPCSIIIICFLSTFYSMFLANLYTEEIVSSWTGSKSNPMTYEVEASSTGPYY